MQYSPNIQDQYGLGLQVVEPSERPDPLVELLAEVEARIDLVELGIEKTAAILKRNELLTSLRLNNEGAKLIEAGRQIETLIGPTTYKEPEPRTYKPMPTEQPPTSERIQELWIQYQHGNSVSLTPLEREAILELEQLERSRKRLGIEEPILQVC